MTVASKAKPSKPAATPAAFFDMPKFDVPKFEFPTFEMPKFDFATFGMPKMEVPAAYREYAEKGMAQAKEVYAKAKANADEANSIVKATLATASKAASDYGLKLTEAARTNTNAAFDFAGNAVATKSISEFIALASEHNRKQFEVLSTQMKELTALAQKLAADTAAPAKNGFEKALKQVA